MPPVVRKGTRKGERAGMCNVFPTPSTRIRSFSRMASSYHETSRALAAVAVHSERSWVAKIRRAAIPRSRQQPR
jgi:hypothetical protein